MSDDFNPLFNFLPLPDEPVRPEQLNDYLRQIDDSLRFLLEEVNSLSNEPFIPSQYYRILGENDDVDGADLPTTVWNAKAVGGPTQITFPSAAAAASVVSDDANDTSAGTGARSIALFGVDANYDYQTEIVDMNGVTPVLSTTQFLFVHLACAIGVGVNTAGTNGEATNIGNITVSIGGNLIDVIVAGQGQSQTSAIVVPKSIDASKSPFITSAEVIFGRQSSGAYITAEAWSTWPGQASRRVASIPVTVTDSFAVQLVPPIPTAAGAQLELLLTEASNNNSKVRAALGISYLTPPAGFSPGPEAGPVAAAIGASTLPSAPIERI